MYRVCDSRRNLPPIPICPILNDANTHEAGRGKAQKRGKS